MAKNRDRNLRIWEMQEIGLVPASRSTIYGWIRTQGFPEPKKIGPRISVWSERAVREWLDNQTQEAA